jgi:invasion protein IalB
MIEKIAFASVQLVRGSFISWAASALLITAAVSVADAQPKPAAPARPAAPAPAQAAPAAAAAPGPQIQNVPLIYAPWAKQCTKPQNGTKQGCVTSRGSFAETGIPAVMLELLEPEGEAKIFRINVRELIPLAVLPGIHILVDQGQPVAGNFSACFGGACMGQAEATPDIVAKMKSGQNLYVQVVAANNQIFSFPFPLSEFKKVNEGPNTDPKVFEEQMTKLSEDLKKRQQAFAAQMQQMQQQQEQQQQAQQPPK